jgi:hypothetical protein
LFTYHITNCLHLSPIRLHLPLLSRCERYILPYFFLDNSVADLGQNDNKHGFNQISILAVEESELTIVVELLNGQYYRDFDDNIPDKSDIFIHTPGRAKYTPSNPSRASFMIILDEGDLDDQNMALPLNLPMQQKRLPGQPVINIGSWAARSSILSTRY